MSPSIGEGVSKPWPATLRASGGLIVLPTANLSRVWTNNLTIVHGIVFQRTGGVRMFIKF